MRRPAWLAPPLHDPDRTATAIDGCAGLCMQYLKTLNVGIQRPPEAVRWNDGLDEALLIDQGVVAEDTRIMVRKNVVAAVLSEDRNGSLGLVHQHKGVLEGDGRSVHKLDTNGGVGKGH